MCLEATMQVLTIAGWVPFSELGSKAMLAVPDPKTRTFKFSNVEVEAFQTDEQLATFDNERMSYAATFDHPMFFIRGEGKADLLKAEDILTTEGNFDDLGGYAFAAPTGDMNAQAQLAAFWLGDGFKISKNTIGFGLKKDRKKEYLRDILARVDADFTEKDHTNRPGYRDFSVKIEGQVEEALNTFINDSDALAKNKFINRKSLESGDGDVIRGLFDALMNSDGHVKKDRPQWQFTSTSPQLHSDFQLLSALLGRDAHFTTHGLSLSYEAKGRTTLSVRPEYFDQKSFDGRVYCAHAPLIFARGTDKNFAFVTTGGVDEVD